MTTHTPTPWQFHKMDGEWPVVFCDKGREADRPIAQIFGPNMQVDNAENTAKANARFIVTACNAHDALKQALTDLTAAIDLSTLNVRKDFHLMNAHASATKTLLALADGKERTP